MRESEDVKVSGDRGDEVATLPLPRCVGAMANTLRSDQVGKRALLATPGAAKGDGNRPKKQRVL